MGKRKTNDLPEPNRVKESTFTLESLINALEISLGNIDKYNIKDSELLNALLCFANEIRELKTK